MRPRDATLPRLERGLRLHPRKRLVLLEELIADLDALEDELASRGIPRGAARAAAIRRLVPGPAAVRELEAAGAAYRRLAGGAREAFVRVAERVAIAGVSAFTLVALGLAVARLGLHGWAGGFAWAMVGAIAVIVANTVAVAVGLWVREDLRAADRRTAWHVQLGLILVAVSLGGLGATVLAYEAAGRIAASPDVPVAFGLIRDVSLLASLGTGAAIIGLSGWLALTPSLRSYDLFERRIAAVFVPAGPRLVRSDHPEETRS